MSVLIKYEKHVRKVDCNSSFPSSSVLQGRGNLTAAVGKNAKTAIRGAITGQWCIHERGQLGFICNYVSNGWFVVFGWPPLFRLKCKPEKRNKKKNLSTLLVHWLCNLSRFLSFHRRPDRRLSLLSVLSVHPLYACHEFHSSPRIHLRIREKSLDFSHPFGQVVSSSRSRSPINCVYI